MEHKFELIKDSWIVSKPWYVLMIVLKTDKSLKIGPFATKREATARMNSLIDYEKNLFKDAI